MELFEHCSLHLGCATGAGELFAVVMNDLLAEERRQHAIPLVGRDGVWSLLPDEPVVPWVAAGVAEIAGASPEVVLVGWAGQVVRFAGRRGVREGLERRDSAPVSIIRSVAGVAGHAYAAGMHWQVYERAGSGAWSEIDHGMAYNGKELDIGFNAVAGFAREEMYAAGLHGALWTFDGRRWRELDSPTNVHLHSICCAADGSVYVGGAAGLLLRGRGDAWKVVGADSGATMWNLHWFGDRLYVIQGNQLRSFRDGAVEDVAVEVLHGEEIQSIASNNETLWVLGQKRVAEQSGDVWRDYGTTLSGDVETSDVASFFTDDVLSVRSKYLED